MQAPEPVKRQADAKPASVPAYFSHWLMLFTAVAALVFAAKWWSGDAPAGPSAPQAPAAFAETESARSTSPAAVTDAPAQRPSRPRVAEADGAWPEAAAEHSDPRNRDGRSYLDEERELRRRKKK